MTRSETPSSACTRRPDEIGTDGFSSSRLAGKISGEERRRRRLLERREGGARFRVSIGYPRMSASGESSTTMHRLLHASGSHPIPPPDDPKTNQYNQDLGLVHSTNGNHLESPNDGSSIDHQVTIYLHAQNITMFPTNETWNKLVVVSVQYGPFNPYIPIRSTAIGKSRVAIHPIAMHTSWRSNSDIVSVTSIGYPRMSASGESSTTMHRLLHASGSHPIPPPDDPKTNQYNQDLGLVHSTNGNHLESPNDGSSIDHQVTIYLHAQNITMFSTNETWYFASQILFLSSGGLILILTAQSTRNMFRIHSDY
ncbi:phosphoglycerate kinase, chloroplastic-like [Dorcoceras hygrometricum]|uniref:Phosphoglycerate kinase, chloroplastic-like n=1 Tax=Dorcoceras hygrometricum TaxID=472368 RepID=A0A2Z7DE63_9LAMI|nr:phosphoglycerate kinase, chloroplastic-like [Dorcoceras hygrometricum]